MKPLRHILSILMLLCAPVRADIPAGQRSALIALYNSTGGSGWTSSTGWKTPPLDADGFAMPGTEGTWYGVTVDGGTDVTELSLADNGLSGSIPAELGNLSNLTRLFLNQNQLTGSIPAALGNLSKVTQFWLSENQLSGSIPPELGGLTEVTYFTLNNNQLSGSIPSSLGNLTKAYTLAIGGNQLTGSIPSELGSLTDVWGLFLSQNQLTGSIPASLGNLTKAAHINLSDNQLSGSIPAELGDLTALQGLYLQDNRLTGEIPSELGNLSNLSSLQLWGNDLSGEIPAALGNLSSLSAGGLDIRYNGLYTDSSTLRSFLNSKQSGGDWESYQTVPPENGSAGSAATTSIAVSWDAIAYTGNTGGYRVSYSESSGGPYTFFAMTANKSATSMTVTGLTPATPYYFVVSSQTNSHVSNQNVLESDSCDEVSATTLSSVSFTDGSGYTPSITPGAAGEKIGRFVLETQDWICCLDAVTIRLNGIRSGYSNFVLWYSAEGSSGQLGAAVPADPGNGESISFSGFSSQLHENLGQTFYLKCNVAAGASGSIQPVIVDNDCLSLTSGVLDNTLSNAVLSDVEASLPVQLSSFSAQPARGGIRLEWITQSETDNLGFILERSRKGQFIQLASYISHAELRGRGNSSECHEYSFDDGDVTPGENHIYRLSDVNTAGEVHVYDVIDITLPESPAATVLKAPFPNPFNPQTRIAYELSEPGPVTITVYDLLGRTVRTLVQEEMAAGSHNSYWHGDDASGRKLATGTYIIVLKAGDVVKRQKAVLTK